ncbi:hypothetical protein D3C71_1434240 [compost metagenome]
MQGLVIDFQCLWCVGLAQRGVARAQVHAAAYQRAGQQFFYQLLQCAVVGVEFEHQFQRAAAGQAKAVGFIGSHAIGHAPGWLGPAAHVVHLFAQAGVALQQVVLYAATGHGAHGLAVFAQRHHGAYGTGRRAPGAHDRGQHGMQALGAPAMELLEDGDVDVVHEKRARQAGSG